MLAAYSAVIYRESSIGEIPFPSFAFFYRTLGILAIILYIFFLLFSLRASYRSPSETLVVTNPRTENNITTQINLHEYL